MNRTLTIERYKDGWMRLVFYYPRRQGANKHETKLLCPEDAAEFTTAIIEQSTGPQTITLHASTVV